MRSHRGGRFARLCGFAALGALVLSAGAVTRAGVGGALPGPLDQTGSAGAPGSPDAEHDIEASPEIRINWLLPANPVRILVPAIRLELVGIRLTTPMEVEVRTIGDAGTLQSRRISPALRETLGVPYRLEIPLRFADGLPPQMTHSGMIVAVVKACATTGRCLMGTSAPRFFHPDGGGFLVYDENGLCRFFACGSLAGSGTPEPGTVRVMGGGPLRAVPSREEPGGESEGPVIDGGQS